MSPPGELAMWLAIGAIGYGFWAAVTPVLKALAQRIAGGNRDEAVAELEERVAALEHRGLTSGEVEAQFARLSEVEERLDFTERVLASRAEAPHPISEERH